MQKGKDIIYLIWFLFALSVPEQYKLSFSVFFRETDQSYSGGCGWASINIGRFCAEWYVDIYTLLIL